MSVFERMARLFNRMYDALRDKRAFTITEDDAVEGNFESLRGHKYAVVVTFRRSGEAVPSPVWFGLDDEGRAYLHTLYNAGKVKRIRNDPRALIVASNARGKPIAPALEGSARVLPKEEWAHAEAALAGAYGLGRKIFQRTFGGPEDMGAYIEITPGRQ